MAHLSAWNFEWLNEIDRILHNQITWNKLYSTPEGDDAFDKKAIEKRKHMSWEEVEHEWNESTKKLIDRLKQLTDEQWNHEVDNEVWSDGQKMTGKPVTVASLFIYEIEGNAHELSHAKAVEKFFM